MVKDIMVRRISDNEVKNSFVFFFFIIINDFLVFINFLMRYKLCCWKNMVVCVKRFVIKN